MQTADFTTQAMRAHPGNCSHRNVIDGGGQQEHIHGSYIYTKTHFKDVITTVVITCARHGDFNVLPLEHLHGGGGCPVCFQIWEDKIL